MDHLDWGQSEVSKSTTAPVQHHNPVCNSAIKMPENGAPAHVHLMFVVQSRTDIHVQQLVDICVTKSTLGRS